VVLEKLGLGCWMLKFIADVNIEKPIVDYLNDNGYDVFGIPNFDCRMNDNELLDLANRENRILITNDKDLGNYFLTEKDCRRDYSF